MDRSLVRPQPQDIKAYDIALQIYVKPKMKHEDALRSALQNLLAAIDRRVGWTLIPDLTIGPIRPEGTFRDDYYLEHGYREAKDTRDNLQTEIQKQIARGYPRTNIIFEDTQQVSLSQNGKVALQVDLTQPQQLINRFVPFFSYTEPAHEDFNTAVEEFKQRVPDLAYGLGKIQEAQKTNTNFKKAFESFFALSKNSYTRIFVLKPSKQCSSSICSPNGLFARLLTIPIAPGARSSPVRSRKSVTPW